jgi:hypothetical protein
VLLLVLALGLLAGGPIATVFEPNPDSDAWFYITVSLIEFALAAGLAMAALSLVDASGRERAGAVGALALVAFPFPEALDSEAGNLLNAIGGALIVAVTVNAWRLSRRPHLKASPLQS